MTSNSLFIILGNQLFPIKFLSKYKKSNFFMSEDIELCSYKMHHKLKIVFFLNSMREYADSLKKKNFNINYHKLNKININSTYEEKLIDIILDKKITHIYFYEIEDKFFENKILKFLKNNNLNFTIIQSPMFLNSRIDFRNYLKSVKKPFMSVFYKQQRYKTKLLMDINGDPIGGKWSFDEDNRKKIPKNMLLPKIPKKRNYNIRNFKSIKILINKYFKDHPGTMDYYWLASKRSEVRELINEFIENRLIFFGDYEDAVIKENFFLFHSFLSPYLNNGLTTPQEIIDILSSKKELVNKFSINNIEGFVRQLIGWREFIRGIYQNFSIGLETKNFYGHKKKLTKDWYEGTTGIDPSDDTIKNILKYGYAHHIIRLMYLSNIMNLAEIQPVEIYNWFMEMFVDSSDWVMVPNVYGMGTYSDGGIFSTKPYLCGSNYIIKMSDYKKGKWSEIVDGLYWNFVSKNMKSIEKNPRMGMVKLSFNKISSEKLQLHKTIAKKFIIEKTN